VCAFVFFCTGASVVTTDASMTIGSVYFVGYLILDRLDHLKERADGR
jgi:hypothetical protein